MPLASTRMIAPLGAHSGSGTVLTTNGFLVDSNTAAFIAAFLLEEGRSMLMRFQPSYSAFSNESANDAPRSSDKFGDSLFELYRAVARVYFHWVQIDARLFLHFEVLER